MVMPQDREWIAEDAAAQAKAAEEAAAAEPGPVSAEDMPAENEAAGEATNAPAPKATKGSKS
jgi:hypothetical protein